jgi:ubiquinone/menaquinone biosynthesis C-methylase UbiE
MLSITQTKLHHLESNYSNYHAAWAQIYSCKDPVKQSKTMVPQAHTGPVDFPQINTHLRQANAEDLSFAKDNSFDAVYSPLCLHLVQNFDVAIGEAYRVLKPGCPFAFTTWGNQPDSKFFTIIQDTLVALGEIKEGGKDEVKGRSPFHLNDKELVIPAMEKAGFKNCRSFEAYTPMFFNEWQNGEQVTKAILK